MKIVFLDAETIGNAPGLDKLKELGDLEIFSRTESFERIDRVKDSDIIITNKVKIDSQLIDSATKLKLICVAATGMNNIDLDYARKKGIEVKNVINYSTRSVAQHTFALLLSLINHIHYFDDYVKSRKYSDSRLFTHFNEDIYEISEKTYGIIGLGNIGLKVAQIADAFGAKVVYYSTSGKNNHPFYKRLELNELLAISDFVSIHAPLNNNTVDLINYEKLGLMKPTAFLVNTGRGGIINECDLATALDMNIIAGAALDVFETEPLEPDNPLLYIENRQKLILSPHVAWTSVEARTELINQIAKNIIDFVDEYEMSKQRENRM